MALTMGGDRICKVYVGEIKMYEKYADIRLFNSGKDRNGNWVTDFSIYARFIGRAHTRALTIHEKDQIEITQASITTHWDHDKQCQKFDRLCVWEFNVIKGENLTPEFARTTSRRQQQPMPSDAEINAAREAAMKHQTGIEADFMNSIPNDVENDLPFQ